MDLMEIGSALREARERKGLSIEAVEERVKIAQSVIIALEEGNKEKFPHPVYARGFVRSYAMLLGLDHQEVCAHFAREYPVPVEVDHYADDHGPQITVRLKASNKAPVALWVAAILGLAALAVVSWYAYDTYLGKQSVDVSPAAVEPAPQAVTPPATMQAPEQSVPLTQMREVSDDPANASNPADLRASSVTDQNASAVAVPSQIEDEPQAEEPAPGSAPDIAGKRTMVVSAHSASWLQAKIDDKITDYFLRKGESATLVFSKSLTIKFGNAGGVDLTLDGKPYPLDAKPGEVKSLVVK